MLSPVKKLTSIPTHVHRQVNGLSLVDQPHRQAVQLLKSVTQEGILIIRRNHKEEVRNSVSD